MYLCFRLVEVVAAFFDKSGIEAGVLPWLAVLSPRGVVNRLGLLASWIGSLRRGPCKTAAVLFPALWLRSDNSRLKKIVFPSPCPPGYCLRAFGSFALRGRAGPLTGGAVVVFRSGWPGGWPGRHVKQS